MNVYFSRDRPRVIVSVNTAHAVGRRVWHGIIAAANRLGPWDIRPDFSSHASALLESERLQIDGLIVQPPRYDPPDYPRLFPGPIVCLAEGPTTDPRIGRVVIDQGAAGRLAFGHLRDQGYRHFGVAGQGHNHAAARFAGFADAAHQFGVDRIHVCQRFSLHEPTRQAIDRVERWLADLPRPIGIFCVQDQIARVIAEACIDLGIRVPGDVGIVGLNDDPIVCEMTRPLLTSVDHNAEKLGDEAAALMHRLLTVQAAPPAPVVVPPRGIIVRESTDAMLVDDPHIAAAIRHVRDHACDGLTVDQLLDHIPVSRRKLEYAFREHVGRTPHQEILRVRLAQAQQLLCETDMPMPEITERCGFKYPSQFSHAFRRAFDTTPRAFRMARSQRGR